MQAKTSSVGGTAIALLALFALGCGESRQEKFDRALRVAESAQEAVESARKEVAENEARFEKASEAAREAEDDLGAARGKLDAAQSSLAGARAEVAKWADDASVFRVVQQRLLEDGELDDAAVSARVEQGVAVLEGNVATEAERDRAIAIARETPGIAEVQSRLTVGPETGLAPATPPPPIEVVPPAIEPPPEALPEVPPDAANEESIDPALPPPH
jgi:osmotically-inducible protein OsmY